MESLFNNTKQYLPSLTAWTGRPEVTSGFVNLAVNVITTQDCTLTVYQSTDGSTFDFADQFALPVSVFGNQTRTQFAVKALYVKVNVFNDTLVDIPNLIVTTTFSATSQDSSIEQPVVVAGNVTVLNAMKARDYTDNSVREVSCDINGQLKVVPVGTTDVSVYGQNLDFNFYPTVENNTATVYADGVKGTDVQGGWLYSNGATSKINWYLYTAPNPTGNPTSKGQNVASVNSMYAVVNNLSTLGLSQAQNPFIILYTRPDSGTNATGWYKSKLFFGSNAFTNVNGIKLLYTGTDPTDVHPEITGNNRINLLFNLSLSTKSVEDASTESVLFGTLQTTNNTSTVGSFNFVFSQFGISWVKQLVPLPIVDNAVNVNVNNSVVVKGMNGTTSYPLATNATGNLILGASTSTIGTVNVSTPTTYSTRVKTAGNSPVTINSGGHLLSFTLVNTSSTINAYVKLYDSVAPPDPATDVPFMVFYVEHKELYSINTQQVNLSNLAITNTSWVRATQSPADIDTNDTGISLEMCFFGTAV
jgi:hypothetical protein